MKLVFLGVGEVAKCTLHLLEKFLTVPAHEIYFVERNNETTHPVVNGFIARGARYIRRNIRRENILTLLKDEIGMQPGDLVLDLSTDTDMFHTVELCLAHQWLYLNTCIENSADAELIHFRNHAKMARVIASPVGRAYEATCVFDHGMNPGLISSFVKKGLEDIASLVLQRRINPALKAALAHAGYARIAELLGLEALHLSELDDQTGQNIPEDIFVNTWSCPGFLVEANAPVQVAWGTHETRLPPNMRLAGPNVLISENAAWKNLASSYVPHRPIQGMLIPHEEIMTLRTMLERPGYAPTIAYIYEINPHTRRCFDEGILDEPGKVLNPAEHALAGADRVGALFILRENPVTGENKPWSYWCGTILETGDSLFSPTVIQVAAGVLAAVQWISENPRAGIVFPEDLPHAQILQTAAPYLGEIFSSPVDFFPAGTGFDNFLISSFSETRARLLR